MAQVKVKSREGHAASMRREQFTEQCFFTEQLCMAKARAAGQEDPVLCWTSTQHSTCTSSHAADGLCHHWTGAALFAQASLYGGY